MKILIITSSYPSNPSDSINAGVFVRDFAKELRKRGHSVEVLTPRKGKGDYDDEVNAHYFWWFGKETSLTYLNLRNPIHLLKAFSLFLSGILNGLYLCAKTRYDHIISMWAVPSGLIAWVLNIFTWIPYSVWCLGSDIWEVKKIPLGKMLLKRIMRDSKKVFADGYELREDVEKISGRQCIFLPSSRVLPSPEKIEIKRDKKNFLFIGRFHKNKGPDLLLNAIKILDEEKRKGSVFYLFGDGPMRDSMEKLIEENGIGEFVKLKGYADPLTASSYLHSCDALIIPSRIESIPIILSDAAQAGIPVIATDVGDMGEIVKEYGCGMVVKPDAQSIKEGIEEFFERRREEFSEGLERLKMDFSIDGTVEKFLREI